jgi:integrase/recombinase XerD
LDKLLSYLMLEKKDWLDVTLSDLEHFSAGLHDIEIGARSQARILSGVRSFYHFLVLEDYIAASPPRFNGSDNGFWHDLRSLVLG